MKNNPRGAVVKDVDFLRTLQKFVAIESVGVSAMRGQGAGVLDATRSFLGRLQLARLGNIRTKSAYLSWLNRQTESLLRALPRGSRPWGAARKAINLFLRTCLYNKYLSRKYHLVKIERWMEIPLDSYTAEGLRTDDSKMKLPPWPGLKYMTKDISDKYQNAACSLAKNKSMSCVNMDVILWLKVRADKRKK